ncbi:hypothetical protein [Nocardia grenadensis]|uniref:hypothetical protein n=1 Tax=Nocardia grenadensis TaxID=931537 RepID=UPI0007A51D45|nr:hypothetical protein [Nocardia grenadensis]
MTFTDRLTVALAASATDDTFDSHAELGELLAGIGTQQRDRGTITFRSADPVVPIPSPPISRWATIRA